MVKTITVLLGLALAMPSTVMGQPRMVPADQVTKTWIFDTNPASIEGRRSVGRIGVQPATNAITTTPDVQEPPDRNWAARHPVALGAMIGAVGGGLWGASFCWKQPPCGDNHGPLLVLFGAGLGAGIGAGVGVTISIATR